MNYVVPPKKVISYMGQNYGAGETVPGYVEEAKPIVMDKLKKTVAQKTIVPRNADTEGV